VYPAESAVAHHQHMVAGACIGNELADEFVEAVEYAGFLA